MMESQHFDEAAWVADLVTRFGPVVGGDVLKNLLGFRTAAAFQRATADETLGTIKTFELPGRKGRFAITSEVGWWLMAHRRGTKLEGEPRLARREEGAMS